MLCDALAWNFPADCDERSALATKETTGKSWGKAFYPDKRSFEFWNSPIPHLTAKFAFKLCAFHGLIFLKTNRFVIVSICNGNDTDIIVSVCQACSEQVVVFVFWSPVLFKHQFEETKQGAKLGLLYNRIKAGVDIPLLSCTWKQTKRNCFKKLNADTFFHSHVFILK